MQLRESGLVAKLRDLLDNGPRQRFHAARGLVYMGELELGTTNMFSDNGEREGEQRGKTAHIHNHSQCSNSIPAASSYEVDSVVMSTDEDDGHSYARYVCMRHERDPFSHCFSPLLIHSLSICRGATVEKCVEFLTDSTSHLWGGFSLIIGPQAPSNELRKKATKQQIINFFLTCYQSFMHPLILMRLLLHRLATPCSQNPFDWSVKPDKHSMPALSHTDSLPTHLTATLKVIGHWLEHYPDDFLQHQPLQVHVHGV